MIRKILLSILLFTILVISVSAENYPEVQKKSVSYPSQVKVGEEFSIDITYENVGGKSERSWIVATIPTEIEYTKAETQDNLRVILYNEGRLIWTKKGKQPVEDTVVHFYGKWTGGTQKTGTIHLKATEEGTHCFKVRATMRTGSTTDRNPTAGEKDQAGFHTDKHCINVLPPPKHEVSIMTSREVGVPITIDGEDVCTSAYTYGWGTGCRVSLTEGEHTIEIKGPLFKPYSKAITVPTTRWIDLPAQLASEYYQIKVISNVNGVKAKVTGSFSGYEQCITSLDDDRKYSCKIPRSYPARNNIEVEFSKDGYIQKSSGFYRPYIERNVELQVDPNARFQAKVIRNSWDNILVDGKYPSDARGGGLSGNDYLVIPNIVPGWHNFTVNPTKPDYEPRTETILIEHNSQQIFLPSKLKTIIRATMEKPDSEQYAIFLDGKQICSARVQYLPGRLYAKKSHFCDAYDKEELTPGTHTIEARAQGHDPVKKTITVEPNTYNLITVPNPTPKEFPVTFRSNLKDVAIYGSGATMAAYGRCNTTLDAVSDDYSCTLTLHGFVEHGNRNVYDGPIKFYANHPDYHGEDYTIEFDVDQGPSESVISIPLTRKIGVNATIQAPSGLNSFVKVISKEDPKVDYGCQMNGKTICFIPEMPIGYYTVQLVKHGYHTYEEDVEVTGAWTYNGFGKLQKIYHDLTVNTNIPADSIEIQKEVLHSVYQGENYYTYERKQLCTDTNTCLATNLDYDEAVFRYKVIAKLSGYPTIERSVAYSEEEVLDLEFIRRDFIYTATSNEEETLIKIDGQYGCTTVGPAQFGLYNCRIVGLKNGNYDITASKEGFMDISSGLTISGDDVEGIFYMQEKTSTRNDAARPRVAGFLTGVWRVEQSEDRMFYPVHPAEQYDVTGGFNEPTYDHGGIDYAPRYNKDSEHIVYSTTSGEVIEVNDTIEELGHLYEKPWDCIGAQIEAKNFKSYGNRVKVRYVSPNGIEYTILYAHLESVNVQRGDTITAGDTIGVMGNTGCSFGKHLHFEVREGDQKTDPYKIYGAKSAYPTRANEYQSECGEGHLWYSCPPISKQVYDTVKDVEVKMVEPYLVRKNGEYVFNVKGKNLPDGMTFYIPGCEMAPGKLPGANTTLQQFQCRLKYTEPGWVDVLIKNKPGNEGGILLAEQKIVVWE